MQNKISVEMEYNTQEHSPDIKVIKNLNKELR